MRNAFKSFDADGDGFISFEEARQAMAPRGFTEEEIITTFHAYDKNGDEKWNYIEFATFWNIPIFWDNKTFPWLFTTEWVTVIPTQHKDYRIHINARSLLKLIDADVGQLITTKSPYLK